MIFTPAQTQTDPQCDGDVVPLAPTDSWTGVEQALAKLAQDAARDDRRVEMDPSAGLRAAPVEITLSRADVKTGPLRNAMPSLGRQAAPRIARWLIAAAVGAAATLGYQSYGGSLQGVMARWGLVRTEPAAAELASEQTASGLPVQESTPQGTPAQATSAQATPEQAASVQATPAAQSAPDLVAPVTPADSQQLEALARDVAAVRQMLERLAAGQEQMAREIAKLQAAEQGVPHRTVLPPPRPAAAPARKPVSVVPPTPDKQMSSAASAPPDQQPAPPPPSVNVLTPPFRPPMPVPVSPEARAF